MKKLFFAFGLLCLISVAVTSCKKDNEREPICEDGSAPTYDEEMKSLIDSKCATSGCHGSGSSNGDYTAYSGMVSDLNNGSIKREVLDRQDMPKNSTLSQNELNQFQCWSDNGFSEN
ncbi:MAG: hypothetical protein AB8B53_01220 [Flavobacteriales bacterium]